jgi:transposase
VLESLDLDVREWTCPNCGARHDRDFNAANSVLAEGLAVSARLLMSPLQSWYNKHEMLRR